MSTARVFCCTLLLALSSLAAHAATVVIDHEVPPAVAVSGAAFDADLDLGRAWVVVDFLEQGGEDPQVHSQRLSVPGLTYDAATRTIHLQEGDRNVTCALGKKLLWATSFRSTPQCLIRVQQVPQAQVDGAEKGEGEKARFVVEVGTAP